MWSPADRERRRSATVVSGPVLTGSQAISILDALSSRGRLEAVRELNVVDAPPHEALGSVSRLARQLLGVPVSVVSILTESRAVSVADGERRGGADHPEQALSHSFCKTVVATGEAMIVDDARDVPDLARNLAVRDHGVIAYAGFPLRLDNGEVVGAFCAVDHEPRRWSPDQLAILRDLAQVVVELLENRRRSTTHGLRDHVTGLAGPALFAEQVGELLADASPAERVSIVAVDLAGFTMLSDAWGTAGGDAVLTEAGLRLDHVAHSRRQPGRVCRLAGDTFLVASTMKYSEPRGRLEEQLLQAIVSRQFTFGDASQALGARVVTVTGQPGSDPAELIAAADQAMRETRVLDGSAPRPVSGGAARRRLLVRNALEGALERGEFTVHHQAIWDLARHRITGFEALVRWNHPDLGTIEPTEFVPIAQSSGAIVPIGEWVLETALTDLATWRELAPELDLTMAVNVAPEQLLTEAFPARVAEALGRAEVPARALTLEITEHALRDGRPSVARVTAALRSLGCTLSLDDFGTSLSTLAQLAGSSVDELKIDREVVAQLGTAISPRFIAGLVAMAGALGMRVVAEGIENGRQRDLLAEAGCTHGQGFLLSDAMSARVVLLELSRARLDAAGSTSSDRGTVGA